MLRVNGLFDFYYLWNVIKILKCSFLLISHLKVTQTKGQTRNDSSKYRATYVLSFHRSKSFRPCRFCQLFAYWFSITLHPADHNMSKSTANPSKSIEILNPTTRVKANQRSKRNTLITYISGGEAVAGFSSFCCHVGRDGALRTTNFRSNWSEINGWCNGCSIHTHTTTGMGRIFGGIKISTIRR